MSAVAAAFSPVGFEYMVALREIEVANEQLGSVVPVSTPPQIAVIQVQQNAIQIQRAAVASIRRELE